MGGNDIHLLAPGRPGPLGAPAQSGRDDNETGSIPPPAGPGTTPSPPIIAPPVTTCHPAPSLQTCQAYPGQSAESFLRSIQSRIRSLEADIGRIQTELSHNQAVSKPQSIDVSRRQAARDRLPGLRGELGEYQLLLWLARREAGQPQPINTLMAALRGSSNNVTYWKAQIAMILSSELENPEARQALSSGRGTSRIISDNGWVGATDPLERERLALEQIHAQLLTENGRPIDQLSLLIGENYYRRALIAKNLGRHDDYQSLMAQARTYVGRLATLDDTISSEASCLNNGRSSYTRPAISGSARNNYQLLRRELAWANYLMASILMREAEEQADPRQATLRINEAVGYLSNTGPLIGFPQLAARTTLADALVSLGQLRQETGGDQLGPFSEALCHLDAIIRWHDEYRQGIGQTGVAQRWLVNITVNARAARAKLIMQLTNRIEERTPNAIIQMLNSELDALNLSPTDRQAISSCANSELVGRVRTLLLERQAGELEILLGERYHYATNPPVSVPVLDARQQTELRQAIGESLAQRAFISRERNDLTAYRRLRAEAQQTLGQVCAAPANQTTPFSRAMAHYWLAKLAVIDLGEAHTYDENLALIEEARRELQGARDTGALRGTMLRLAEQTELELDLWAVELRMRRGEAYSTEDLTTLENLAFRIFRHQNASPELIDRAVNDLIEAYSVRKSSHARIILIGNVLLGRNISPPNDPALQPLLIALRGLRGRLIAGGPASFPTEFQALLYLRLAEAVSWGGRAQLESAEAILAELAQQLPAEIMPATGEPRVVTSYQLLRAELRMRISRNADPIMEPELVRSVIASNNPDLIVRLAHSQLEGLELERDFRQAIGLLRDLRSAPRLQQVEQLFGQDRRKSFLRYQLQLQLNLGRVLSWDRQYQPAIDELTALLSSRELTSFQARDPSLADQFSVLARVELGNLYRYDWVGRDLDQAVDHYGRAVARHPNLDPLSSPDLLMALAQAHLGLAEIRRMSGPHRDLLAAETHYQQVRQIADRLSDDPEQYHELLARAFLGMAYLARAGSSLGQQDLYLAARHIETARHHVRRMSEPPEELADEIERFYNDHNLTSRLEPEFGFGARMVRGANGRIENQFTFDFHAPLDLGLSDINLSWIHWALREQIDLSSSGALYTTYAGARLYPWTDLSLEALARLGTAGADSADIHFFYQPDLKLNGFLWTDYATLGAALGINYRHTELNTYYASAAFNLAWTRVPVLQGFRLGVEWNRTPYYVQPTTASREYADNWRTIDSIAFGPRFEINPTSWLSLQGNFMGLQYFSDDRNSSTVDEWQWGWQAGAGIGLHPWRWLHLDLGVNHQATGYPLTTLDGSLRITF